MSTAGNFLGRVGAGDPDVFFMIFCVFHPEKCRDWVRTKPRLASNSRYLFSAKKMASEMLVNDYLSKEIFGCSFQDINQLRLVVPIEM